MALSSSASLAPLRSLRSGARHTPSSKALGKRPAPAPTPPAEEKKVEEKAREKRVLPSRSLRAFSGVHLAVDDLILDAQQRAATNKPVLPPSALFTLTTDSTLAPLPSTSASHASTRQERGPATETPEFHLLDPTAVVSRLRVRVSEDEPPETSDQAYISRHRKYEMFEKRQRLREKEKLTHERYQLKSRIDQLRSNTHHGEGEERRRSLLREAEELQKRYDVLLGPPAGDKKAHASYHANNAFYSHSDANGSDSIKLKFKLSKALPFHPSSSPTPNRTPSPPPTPPPPPTKRLKLKLNLSSSSAPSSPHPSHPPPPPRTPIILEAALYNAQHKRKTPIRQNLAFGVKLPECFDEVVDFELPFDWIEEREAEMEVD